MYRACRRLPGPSSRALRRHIGATANEPPAAQPGPASDPYPLPLQHTLDESPHDTAASEPHPQDVPRQADEDLKTMRSRLVYQTRKRGTLETGLLFSTFATVERLEQMNKEELQELDRLLTVPEWTLYYWCIGKQSPAADSPWTNSKLLDQLRHHSKNTEGVVRAMPDLPS